MREESFWCEISEVAENGEESSLPGFFLEIGGDPLGVATGGTVVDV